MQIAVVLSVHENSPVYRDTLESVKTYLSDDVVLLVDGFAWKQFEQEKVEKIEGFRHGKPSAPVRNMALGLMEAWKKWGNSKNWYCYMEYDCLVGSGETLKHLAMADERGYWLLGNDLRELNGTMPELERICGASGIKLYSFLGCCLFFSSKFISELNKNDFFRKFLDYTNFFSSEFKLFSEDPAREYFGNRIPKTHTPRSVRPLPVYDSSEFIYPSLAVHYGGSVEQLASWDQTLETWGGNCRHYPMRFTPDLSGNDPFQEACIMHPIKDANNPIRAYHRALRNK